MKTKFRTSKKMTSSFRSKNKDKQMVEEKETPPRSISPKLFELPDSSCESYESSLNSLSTSCLKSTEFPAQPLPQTPNLGSYVELRDLNRSSKSSKPPRKALKKTASMPCQPITSRSMSHVHSQSGGTLVIGSPVQVVEQNTNGMS